MTDEVGPLPDLIRLRSAGLTASINTFGAELTSLRDAGGRELMTDADPAFWTGHAPILFPIVGRLNDDVLRVDGREYRMKQHGFARRQTFSPVARDDASVTLRLSANEETRAIYPFDFVLDVHFSIAGATLAIEARIANPGAVPLPASFGFHPAFAWPLPYGRPRDAHRIVFADDVPEPVERLAEGLIAGDRPSPLNGRTLHLADDLFADDALIWNPVRSQSVTYGADHGPQLRVDFPDTPQLGVWTKPGAHFVCIEPWHGHADPQGFTGEFRDKPGVFKVAPGRERRCTIAITLER
ncbi:aldose 1-epimerase family protein [Sphingomonas sp.]|uniref:aldose 1-epimerase family protein n=1 Tax=Sphingomonas sp. TaxID=28214 RepID=UPI002E333A10|nr:aldose 1-epimerase family protein [Sphingomonas sp.]HEX4695074.1 aldose 1-epimerase family protein [Sphingomonas sp.]